MQKYNDNSEYNNNKLLFGILFYRIYEVTLLLNQILQFLLEKTDA